MLRNGDRKAHPRLWVLLVGPARKTPVFRAGRKGHRAAYSTVTGAPPMASASMLTIVYMWRDGRRKSCAHDSVRGREARLLSDGYFRATIHGSDWVDPLEVHLVPTICTLNLRSAMPQSVDVNTKLLARQHDVTTLHEAMPNGELRFRLIGPDGSSYIRTVASPMGAWQNSH
jgi:hypothetical protein